MPPRLSPVSEINVKAGQITVFYKSILYMHPHRCIYLYTYFNVNGNPEIVTIGGIEETSFSAQSFSGFQMKSELCLGSTPLSGGARKGEKGKT